MEEQDKQTIICALARELQIANELISELVKGIRDWGELEDGIPVWFGSYEKARRYLNHITKRST